MTNDNHPKVLDFKQNEFKTLEFLKNRRLLKGFSDLDESIDRAFFAYKDPERLKRLGFQFHADFWIEVQKKWHRILVEALISEAKGTFNECTYSLSIAKKEQPNELIRKFHFDHAHPSIRTNQPVPIFHLQYGGTLSPTLQGKGILDAHLEKWLSLPRLTFPPVNLALLLDTIFFEFRTEETNKIIESSEWRGMIYKNEQFILTQYYRAIGNFCGSAHHKTTRLIRDFCYGE